MKNTLVTLFLAVLSAIFSLPADAGGIGRSSPPAARATPSATARPPASVGMSRPALVAQQKAQQAPAIPARPSPAPAPAAAMTPQQSTVVTHTGGQAGSNGPGWGTVAAAGAGGALVGHMLTDRTPAVVAAPAAAVSPAPLLASPGVGSYAAPVAYGTNYTNPLLNFLVGVALLLTVAALCFYLYTNFMRHRAEQAVKPMAQMLPFSPMRVFWDVQEAFAEGNKDKLGRLLGPDMVEATRTAQSQPMTISNGAYSVVSMEPDVITIRYSFEDQGERACQLWHFIQSQGEWVLNGTDNL